MVDDDEEDIYLTKRAFCSYKDNLNFVSACDSDAFFNYLYKREYQLNHSAQNSMIVVLLDINIPRENGFDILKKIKSDTQFNHIPVVMLTTSTAEHDIREAYKLGASSFISKSVNAAEMKRIAEHFCQYWFDFVKIPQILA